MRAIHHFLDRGSDHCSWQVSRLVNHRFFHEQNVARVVPGHAAGLLLGRSRWDEIGLVAAGGAIADLAVGLAEALLGLEVNLVTSGGLACSLLGRVCWSSEGLFDLGTSVLVSGHQNESKAVLKDTIEVEEPLTAALV